MSVGSVFEDAVKICEFYADPCESFEVDLENYHVTMGDYGVGLLMGKGDLVSYLVEEPDGASVFIDDLDEYFQRVFCWEER